MRYRVTVRGALGPRAIALLDGAIIEQAEGDTSFVIEIVDQADLYGVLDVLQRVGIELVSVSEIAS